MEEIVYKAIFQDTPHAPYAVGNCTLEPRNKDGSENKRLPRMHRLAEKRRIYEQINHIRYSTSEGEYHLSRDLRDHLASLAFEKGETLSKKLIKNEITVFTGQTVVRINLYEEEKSVKGFCHVAAFANVPAWHAMSEDEQDAVINFIAEPAIDPTNPTSELYPEDEFLERLCGMLQLEGPDAEAEATTVVSLLVKDRCKLGLPATVRMLEKLINGLEVEIPVSGGGTQSVWRAHSHRSAADACGFIAEEEQIRALEGTYSALPYYGEVLRHDVTSVHPWHKNRAVEEEQVWGRVPNPVVHVALNQLRRVINEVIALYGKPESIHVELARELGMSAANRKALQAEMQKKERENERINKELIKLNLTPNRNNRTKYKLWEEQGRRSLFSLKEIEPGEIEQCEIVHLIPPSQGGTDSMMNLCLAFAGENKTKGETFPYETIQRTAPDKWKEISRVISKKPFPKAKAWRFHSDAATHYAAFGDESRTDSRFHDGSYMAKMAARYLRVLCSSVVAVKDGTTSILRQAWGLGGLEYELLGLPIKERMVDEKGKEIINPATGYPERNPLWTSKPRIDYRYHALDALVAACTTRGMVARLVREEKRGWERREVPVPFGDCASDFRYQALEALRRIIVSPKAEHATAGQLHDLTKYRILWPNPEKPEGNYLIRYRQKFDTIKDKKDVANILFNTNTIPLDNQVTKTAHAQCIAIINTIERYYPVAEAELQAAQEAAAKGGKAPRIIKDKAKEEAIVREAIRLAQQDGLLGIGYPCLANKRLVAINKALQFGYEPKNNYCMDFYENKNGNVGWECVTRIDANNATFIPKWKKEGGKHLWSLHIGDVIEVTPTDKMRKKLGGLLPPGKVYLVVQKMGDGRLQCNLLHDSRPKTGKPLAIKAGLVEYEEYKRWDTGGITLTAYCELAARKVEVSPFGKILRKHKRLWSKKK
jgi:CRISPR-associated endonuclease Csn1